jgi:hypothetical protein
VTFSISTKRSGSCRMTLQIASAGSAAVTKTQSGSATPLSLSTNLGSQPSIHSASRTGHSSGNTRAGEAANRCT